MTTWFVSRHPGALEWAKRQGLTVDRVAAHLDIDLLTPGDTVIGTLPVNRVADLQRVGASYLHLVLELPPEWRGRELSADEMDAIGARLQAYRVEEDPDRRPEQESTP